MAQPTHAANPEHMEDPYVVRTSLPVLHRSRKNGAKWFKNNTEVSTAVRKIIQGCFKGPWHCWKKVPPYYKRTWFTMFKAKFNWDASMNYQVEKEFNKLAAYRLKGIISAAKSAVKKGAEKPDYILSDYWTLLEKHWATPRAIKTSESARASRLSDRNGLGAHRHRAGSCSYAKVQDVLEANNEDCSFIAVLKKTHRRPNGTYVDEKARTIAETYDKHVQERVEQLRSSGMENVTAENLDQSEKNEIYMKAAGLSKQGYVFGLGALHSKISPSCDDSPTAPQASGDVEMLTQRLEEVETELKQSREENVKFEERLKQMENIVKSFPNMNV